MTTTSETAFPQSAATVYDFVTNPQNWATTYPGSAHIGRLPELPLKAGDTWVQAGPANPAKIGAYHEAVARELTRSAD